MRLSLFQWVIQWFHMKYVQADLERLEEENEIYEMMLEEDEIDEFIGSQERH